MKTHVVIIAALCLTGSSASVSAQHPPMPRAAGVTPGGALNVFVTRIGPDGQVGVASGAEVVLEHWIRGAPPMNRLELDLAWSALTSAGGSARFEVTAAPRPGESYRVQTVYRDVRYPAVEIQRPVGTHRVTVYEPSPDPSPIRLDLQVDVRVGEGGLVINHVTRIINPTSRVIVLDREGVDGIRIPLLHPSAWEDSIDYALLPPAWNPERTKIDRSPDIGRLIIDRGALFYRGPVFPGRDLTVTVVYELRYDDDQDYLLALRPPHDVERFVLTHREADRIAAQVAPRQPFAPLARDLVEGRERYMTLITPPKAGEVVLVDVRRTPARSPLFRGVAVAGALIVLALFALGLAAAWRRREVG